MEEANYYSEQEHAGKRSSADQDPFPTPRKNRSDNTKRFSDEQVKSLESMFHRGAKLEPRNKLQLAKDLGLQPRQVSIWFQNKRARWKSKKMEQEYTALRANFDALYQQYESLKKENESLLEQLGRLNGILEKPNRKQSSSRDSNENANTNAAPTNTTEHNSELEESHEMMTTNADVDKETGINNEYFTEQEEPECSITFSDQEDSWKASSRKQWFSFFPGGILDDPSCPSNWWDF